MDMEYKQIIEDKKNIDINRVVDCVGESFLGEERGVRVKILLFSNGVDRNKDFGGGK